MQSLLQVAAQARFRFEGANELPTADQRNILAIALEVLREPIFLLLVEAGAIYLLPRCQRLLDVAGYRIRGNGHHDLSGIQDGARVGGIARPNQSVCFGTS